MSSVVDEKGRVIIPKHVAEELNLNKGDMIAFEKREHLFVVRKAGFAKRRLEEIMDWNPERTSEPEPVSAREMKEIWKA